MAVVTAVLQTSKLIQVLELVLQHHNVGLNAASLCNLLRSSKAVREAAQQAGGPCASICIKGKANDWQVASTVASFARWLPPHAHLAAEIALDLERQPAEDDDDDNDGDAANHQRVSGAWLAAAQALSQLTFLEISAVDCYLEELQQLPAGLERLALPNVYIYTQADEDDKGAADAGSGDEGGRAQHSRQIDLSHLTRLTQLELGLHGADDELLVSGQLPPQLLQLTTGADSDEGDSCAVLPLLGGAAALKQLQRLTLSGCCESESELLALNSLTALSHMELAFDDVALSKVQSSSAWAALPQLRALVIVSAPSGDVANVGPSLRTVMAGIAAATSLRQLHLDFRDGVPAYSMRPKLFGFLTGLRQLQELEVLELVLQNPSLGLDAVTLCSLLCSSKAVRAAAQQEGGPCTSICVKGDLGDWQLASRVATFARWLPPHTNLAAEIAFDFEPQSEDDDNADGAAAKNVLDSLLAFSAQKITAARSSTNAGDTAAPSSQQQQQRPPFALRSFSSSVPHSGQLLRALPPATLTSLSYLLPDNYDEDQCAAPAALAGLTNLRCLQHLQRIPGKWLDPVAALTQLTLLVIGALDCYLEELQQLPASLQRLALQNVYIHLSADEDEEGAADAGSDSSGEAQHSRQIDLSHLTRLTQLELGLHGADSDAQISGQLPPQLLELTAGADRDDGDACAVLPLLGGVAALKQLRRLALSNCCEAERDLLALSSLTALSRIDLQYNGALSQVLSSSAWAQLPQLHSLHVISAPLGDVADGGPGLRTLMAGVAAATSLRQLHLDFRDGVSALGMRPKLFGCLTGLRQLQELGVDALPVEYITTDADDVMQLTALTGLTHLDVACWAVGEVAAVALACNLPELRILKLYDCNLVSRAALPAIGKLAHLQHLELRDNRFGCDGCLQLLTQLRALTCLELVNKDGEEPSQQQLDAFWAAVRGQQQGAQLQ
ncbi:hypothetical protein OEZ86_012877 [Tetradesmus obliquus]|nr:hypothetical protein OEZ86_012877 [Tetradesmus obliquus]